MAALMQTRWCHHVAFHLHIEAGSERAVSALHGDSRHLKVVVRSPSTGEGHDRIWQAAVLGFKISRGLVTPVPRINIEHDNARCLAGADADIRVWPLLPPGFDDAFIGRRVIMAVP